ncbi:family transcriptional regulator [Novosphingobium sp. Rr 2-17]|uniref:bifunctional helix-turn-helix transcriptional regulator/GNAT family N-acetyltransferase n=1 Tax=Novosphingobium sp. Rr 2-17 TaxID=555793 RepID=UPI0002698EDD|nr:bifunctional helix-turn-helix transcriptional regulator/GNAT family N-acetyltransferase [Novosphingobium sp. Rr 2-17]EIZ79291.1 family transcriptional regulator [Novosphingobium sp. Rr 2-17]
MSDVLRDMGRVFLGSRLKRLGERMQAGAARVISGAGLKVQPAHMPLLAALDGQAMTIGQLVQALEISQPGVTRGVGQLIDMGLAQAETGSDQRQRTISLTKDGAAAMARAKLYVWPQVTEAVDTLLAGRADAFLAMIAEVEDALAATPLDHLAAHAKPELLSIHEFTDELAPLFHDINAEWITSMFRMEDTDRQTLENPREKIIEAGGAILFVEAKGIGIVGTCALQKTSATGFELTKMGVRKSARGLKAGEFLLNAMIEKASSLGADPLYLLTNHRCASAIHLYQKLGFEHDAGIMADYGARYARCDVAMRYRANPAVDKAALTIEGAS